MNTIPLIPRFKVRTEGGYSAIYWEGTLVAEVRYNLFPERKMLEGYYVTIKKPLLTAMGGRVDHRMSGFKEESEAIEFLRHTCVLGFGGKPIPVSEMDDRPIIRPRDYHITIG